MNKVHLFTAADAKYLPLLEGMLASLEAELGEDLPDITVLNDGFGKVYKQKLKGVEVLDVCDFKLQDYYENFNAFGRSVASLGLRPFLPRFAPQGTDVIVWVDADIWFQGGVALENMIHATNFGSVAAVPEVDRMVSYILPYAGESWKADLIRYWGYNPDIDKFSRYPVLNNGFFAAKTNSLIWKNWEAAFDEALAASKGVMHFGMEQAAFNYAVHKNDLAFVPLPYSYNYNARLATTSLIDNQLCFNGVPFEPIHAIHLIGDSKWEKKPLVVRTLDGRVQDVIQTKLDYFSVQELA